MQPSIEDCAVEIDERAIGAAAQHSDSASRFGQYGGRFIPEALM
jgi:hypothetical protein